MNKPLNIAILGAGNLGIALARLLKDHGYSVTLGTRDVSKTKKKIENICTNQDPSLLRSLNIDEQTVAAENADICVLAISDGAIAKTCQVLAKHFRINSTVVHCSGALDSAILSPASELGCRVGSIHPLNTFPNPESALSLLADNNHNTYLFSEGDAGALEACMPVFSEIGFQCVEIERSAKPLYHAASVFACNYLTTLMSISLETAKAAGLEPTVYWRAIQPLIQSTLSNIDNEVEHNSIADSLSGPIARGDNATIEKHLGALAKVDEALRSTYADLATHTLKLAIERGTINTEQVKNIRRLLDRKKRRQKREGKEETNS